MAKVGVPSDERGASSMVTGASTPFGSAGRAVPPPLASSTPKKRLPDIAHGAVNGTDIPKGKKPKEEGGPAYPDGASPKKRKVLFMSDEEEEDPGVSLALNGYVNSIDAHEQSKDLGQVKEMRKLAELQQQRRQLPIAMGKDALMREIQENDTIVLLGETGSGKTTQVPQYILESGISGSGQIAITQPRRVAATSLAARVADEQGVLLGTRVGYSVRFKEAHSSATRIKYVTDGMLIRELLLDPLLSRYSVIIIDEAHERTLNTDLLIANLKGIQKERRLKACGMHTTKSGKGKRKEEVGPLKVLIMSATLDAEKFSHFFNNAKILYVKGRQHPVKIYHATSGQTDYVDSALRTFFQIHVDQLPGDVLIFLPGQEDIESLDKQITSHAVRLPVEQMRVTTCPLYAALPQNQQTKAFKTTEKGTRKCILATNIAETSITIPGVRYVIDTGKCKEKRYLAGHTGGGLETLLTQDVCKSAAMQRAGRAGREGPGVCFRLYTESVFQNLQEASVPEILRSNLTSSMLQLRCLGQNIETLEFMDKPDGDSLASALKSLVLLGALDHSKTLTPIGRQMNNFPLDPTLSRALIASREFGCTCEVLGIIAVLSASSKLFFDITEQREQAAEARAKFRHSSGDHMTALAAFTAYQELIGGTESRGVRRDWCRRHFVNERTLGEAVDIQDQLRRICEKLGMDWRASCGDNVEPVLKSLLVGYSMHTALARLEGGYKHLTSSKTIKVHPSSVLADFKAPVIMYDELIFTGATYARGVSAIQPTFLAELEVFRVRKAF